MKLSVIVPAFNEAKYLGATLEAIAVATEKAAKGLELIVVDNASSDATALIAKEGGARVISETTRNISRVRNAGATYATGDVLIFIDADTRVPGELFERIEQAMRDERCMGGAVAVDYDPFERWWMRFYAAGWKFWGKVFNMKQGAAQFCRRSIFVELGGFDETIFLGEDVEFYWRLSRLAERRGGRLEFIEDMSVVTSSRRFDKMSLWRTLVLTHPLFILLFYKRASVWKDWYGEAIR
ncbi:MAG TPA: glycosyltransferase [Pyrinomonadaceae bacterium]|nr:glycosyltransferase [Pyrinomonadaceae bacterium]